MDHVVFPTTKKRTVDRCFTLPSQKKIQSNGDASTITKTNPRFYSENSVGVTTRGRHHHHSLSTVDSLWSSKSATYDLR